MNHRQEHVNIKMSYNVTPFSSGGSGKERRIVGSLNESVQGFDNSDYARLENGSLPLGERPKENQVQCSQNNHRGAARDGRLLPREHRALIVLEKGVL